MAFNEQWGGSVNQSLSGVELRIIGVLIEKEVTTPDQYPLSLNALVNACNQKSNRQPVLSLDESEVLTAVDDLRKKHLVLEKSGFGSRVAKYQHRFCNTEFSDLKLSDQQKAILCELFLRGPQTPGELRARASRMAEFASVTDVESDLDQMMNREEAPLVRRLAREPGKRESRYAHLFGGDLEDSEAPVAVEPQGVPPAAMGEDRIVQLEAQVLNLEAALSELLARVEQLEIESR